MNDKLKQFTKPLTPDEIEWKIQSKTKSTPVKTIVVPYIDNRAVMNRLDSVFGSLEWKSSFEPKNYEVTTKSRDTVIHEKRIAMVCTLSIKNSDGEWVSKQDGADGTDIETFKGGISDSMKRCATQWGLGRELYDYPRVFVEGDIKFLDKDILAQLRSIDLKKDVIVLKQGNSQKAYSTVAETKAYQAKNKADYDAGIDPLS